MDEDLKIVLAEINRRLIMIEKLLRNDPSTWAFGSSPLNQIAQAQFQGGAAFQDLNDDAS